MPACMTGRQLKLLKILKDWSIDVIVSSNIFYYENFILLIVLAGMG